MIHKTEQEKFWAGDFGDEYSQRNSSEQSVVSNIALFSKILARTVDINSVLEFGANIGLNLKAIKRLKPFAELFAIEINPSVVDKLTQVCGGGNVYPQSILDDLPDIQSDFVLIKGVLIHINPDFLSDVYGKLYRASNRYICLVEYYNPTPVQVTYRGHEGKLFKRDFAGELMDQYPDLRLVDYGFTYHRDGNFPADDATWFLLEKKG